MARAIVVICILPLTGCAVFSSPWKDPVIAREATVTAGEGESGIATLSTEADRRMIIVNSAGYFLAEPSPDAMTNVLQSLDLDASANTGKEIEAKLELATEVTRQLERLSRRSQGVVFFREATYRLAEVHANDALYETADNPSAVSAREIAMRERWTDAFHDLISTAERLIVYELSLNPTLSSEGTACGDLQRFVDVPRTAKPGEEVTIKFIAPEWTGKKITLTAREGFAEGSATESIEVDVPETGCAERTWTIPTGWELVILEAPKSQSWAIRIEKSPEGDESEE